MGACIMKNGDGEEIKVLRRRRGITDGIIRGQGGHGRSAGKSNHGREGGGEISVVGRRTGHFSSAGSMLDSVGRRQGVAMSSLREAEGPVTVVRAGGMMGCYRAKGVGSPIWLPSFTLRSRSGVATRSIEAPPEFARNPVHVPRPHLGRPPSSLSLRQHTTGTRPSLAEAVPPSGHSRPHSRQAYLLAAAAH